MNKKKYTWKQVFMYHKRAVSLVWDVHPQLLISRLVHVVWTTLTPYVGIYMSALIIEELAGKREVQRLMELIGISLGLAVVISLVGSSSSYNFNSILFLTAAVVNSLIFILDIESGSVVTNEYDSGAVPSTGLQYSILPSILYFTSSSTFGMSL